jgi:lipoyl(octanoyl) transferase 2
VIQLCKLYGVRAFRTKDTGVWCSTEVGEEKIGSIGIHLRRNITSHGIGINITNEVMKYFDVIDACGLGKGVTTMERMGVQATREDVEKRWVECLAEEMDGDVYQLHDVGELEEIWGLEKGSVLDVMIQSDMSSYS